MSTPAAPRARRALFVAPVERVHTGPAQSSPDERSPCVRSHLPVRTAASLTAAVLSLGALAACSEDEPTAAPTGGASQSGEPSRTPAPEPATWPLTGLPVTGDQSVEKRRPVVVLKMDNVDASAPQSGLSQADLVVEEVVEGGLTRLAVFYYSRLPEKVGPVRSIRASDIGIVAPADAVIVTSGGAPVTEQRIADAGVTFYKEGSPGMYRETTHSAPHNLFTDLTETVKAARLPEAQRPPDYLTWGSAQNLPQGSPARSVTASFGGHTTHFDRDGDHYLRRDDYAADGDRFRADTLLMLRVDIGDAGYLDPSDSFVPEIKFRGGQAVLVHRGRAVRARWTKAGPEAPVKLSTADGKELKVPAGRTWVGLVPKETGSVTVQR